MLLKYLRDEDFTNYKKASMFLGTISCNGKCCHEAGIPITVCQNHELQKAPIINYDNRELIKRYRANDITSAIVIGGLEPFEHYLDLNQFIYELRVICDIQDDIVIYTGFYPDEITEYILDLKINYENIIIKYGRYIPNRPSIYDEVLGITLSSDNQYAVKIS